MKKNLTKEWKQLQADTMEFLGKSGDKLVSLDTVITSLQEAAQGFEDIYSGLDDAIAC